MFACLYLPLLSESAGASPARASLSAVAHDFSPRVEVLSDRLVLLDVSGLGRLLGNAQAIGQELRRATAERRLAAHVVIAATRVAAVIVAQARAGLTVVPPGEEPAVLAPLSLRLLEAAQLIVGAELPPSREALRRGPAVALAEAAARPDRLPPIDLLRRWGLNTLGDLAALPRIALSERLGQDGPFWQRIARGEDVRPLVPGRPDAPFAATLDLEWPIDGLEPLSFVLGRLFDPLCRRLEEEDRAAVGFALTLQLVTRLTHARALALPAPIRDPKVLRTLVLLDLESHPPPAAIDRVTIALDPTPGRIVQYSLLTRPLPQPEQVSTMMARLTALMGEGRCGSPALVDTHRPGAFAMKPFAPAISEQHRDHKDHRDHRVTSQKKPEKFRDLCDLRDLHGACAFRRFRIPIPARVNVEAGRPSRVTTGQGLVAGGVVRMAVGPWRSSGDWWKDGRAWDREEWDVALADGAVYRIFFDRHHTAWFVEGALD